MPRCEFQIYARERRLKILEQTRCDRCGADNDAKDRCALRQQGAGPANSAAISNTGTASQNAIGKCTKKGMQGNAENTQLQSHGRPNRKLDPCRFRKLRPLDKWSAAKPADV